MNYKLHNTYVSDMLTLFIVYICLSKEENIRSLKKAIIINKNLSFDKLCQMMFGILLNYLPVCKSTCKMFLKSVIIKYLNMNPLFL